MISENTKIRIVKGCAARGIAKGSTAIVLSVEALGADYSHAARVAFRVLTGAAAGKSFAFYARHPNRLGDPIVNVNDGNPTHKLAICEKTSP